MKKRIMRAVVITVLTFALAGCRKSRNREMYDEAGQALTEGRFEDAEKLFEHLTELEGCEAESYRGKGIALLEQKNYADACISFEKALLYIDDQPESFMRDVMLYLAYARTLHGEWERAEELYTELLTQKSDPEVFFLRGKLYMDNGDQVRAKADFDNAVSLKPDYDLYINIFQVYRAVDKSGDGAVYLEKALVASGGNDHYSRGLVNYYLQNLVDAKEQLILALKDDPEDTSAVFLLGKVYLDMNDVADARAVYRNHVNSEVCAANAYNGLALCDIAEGQYDSALENVKKGLEINDERAAQGLLYNEVVIYEFLNDFKTAKQKCAEYVIKYPFDEKGLRENEFLTTR